MPMRPSRAERLRRRNRPSVRDHPAFQRMDEAAHVARAPRQVEQHIADPLARPVIGITSAAPGLHHLEARIEQFRPPPRWCRRCRPADARAARSVRVAAPANRGVARRSWPPARRDRAPVRSRCAIRCCRPSCHRALRGGICCGYQGPSSAEDAMKFDSNLAWKQASAADCGQSRSAVALAGVFFMLPARAWRLLAAGAGAAPAGARLARRCMDTAAAATTPQDPALRGADGAVPGRGTLALLTLLTDRTRPTVGEAISDRAARRSCPIF